MRNINYRKFEITLVSANDLMVAREIGRMKVYAEVSFGGTAMRTPADRKRKTNPEWGFKIEYTLGETAEKQGDVDLTITLYCKRSLWSDKYVGEVNLSLKELFRKKKSSGRTTTTSIKVKGNDSGDQRGTLNISYKFGERIDPPSKWKRALKAGGKIFGSLLCLGAQIVIPILIAN